MVEKMNKGILFMLWYTKVDGFSICRSEKKIFCFCFGLQKSRHILFVLVKKKWILFMFGLKRNEGFCIVLVYKKLIDFLYVLELVFSVRAFCRPKPV